MWSNWLWQLEMHVERNGRIQNWPSFGDDIIGFELLLQMEVR